MDHAVLEGEAPAADLLEAFQGIPQNLERESPVDRHEVGSGLIVGSDERDGKLHRNPAFRKLVDSGDKAACGDGDASVAEVQTFGIMQERDGLHNIVQVSKRLSHSHENHMAYLARRNVLQVHELLHYLESLQVSL